MNIHEKMETALKLLKEVQNDIIEWKIPKTETNRQIRGLMQTFGEEHFIGGVITMKTWTDDLELEQTAKSE